MAETASKGRVGFIEAVGTGQAPRENAIIESVAAVITIVFPTDATGDIPLVGDIPDVIRVEAVLFALAIIITSEAVRKEIV